MDNSDIDLEISYKPESHNDFLSLEAEVREHLEDYYAQIEFLKETSAAIHHHLQHNCYTTSNPRDQVEIAPDTGNEADQDYYDEGFHNGDANDEDPYIGDADAECHDNFQEEFKDNDGEHEDWDKYHN